MPVLCDVDLEIGAGEKASLVGPSGCGNSTLLFLIAGLLSPDSGTVKIDGTAMSDLDDRARAELRPHRIGIALQADSLWEEASSVPVCTVGASGFVLP